MKVPTRILHAIFITMALAFVAAAEPLPPMLNLPGTGEDPTLIDFKKLPVLKGAHGLVTLGAEPWVFRLHSYLAFFEGKFWCMWSHGPIIEDKPTQHVRYATSADGLHWSEDQLIAGPPVEKGTRYIARGLWVRDGKLIALATLDNQVSARAAKTPWSEDLKLLGFEWDSAGQKWGEAQVIFADTLNNFAPKKLPSGDWAMMRRDHKSNVSMLVGGIDSPSQWKVSDIVTAKDPTSGFRPEEPEWWILPDNRLLGLFRDNSGSKRFFRAVSADNGRTWTPPEKTNFSDATSKFYCLRTSRGYYVLVSNANPAKRNPLCLATSDDGVTFTRLARLPLPVAPEGGEFDADLKVPSAQYPHVLEKDGSLFVAYSRRKTSIEVIQVSLDEIERLRNTP